MNTIKCPTCMRYSTAEDWYTESHHGAAQCPKCQNTFKYTGMSEPTDETDTGRITQRIKGGLDYGSSRTATFK